MSKYEFLKLEDGDGRIFMLLSEEPILLNERRATPAGEGLAMILGGLIVCGLVAMAVLQW